METSTKIAELQAIIDSLNETNEALDESIIQKDRQISGYQEEIKTLKAELENEDSLMESLYKCVNANVKDANFVERTKTGLFKVWKQKGQKELTKLVKQNAINEIAGLCGRGIDYYNGQENDDDKVLSNDTNIKELGAYIIDHITRDFGDLG